MVILRSHWDSPPDANIGPFYYGSLQEAIRVIRNYKGFSSYGNKDIYIIGGAEIYKTALESKVVDRIIMSKINQTYEGDVYFPILADDEWVATTIDHKEGFDVIYLNKKKDFSSDKFPYSGL